MKLINFLIAVFLLYLNADSQNEISFSESQQEISNDGSMININEIFQDDYLQ